MTKAGLILLSAGEAVSQTTFDLSDLMTTSVNSVQTQLFDVLKIVVPSIVVITGAVVAVKFGIGWLRKLGKG